MTDADDVATWRARAEEAERTLAELTLALDRVLGSAKKRREAKVKPAKERQEVYVVPMKPLAEVQKSIAELDTAFQIDGTRAMPIWEQLAETLALVRAISQGASVAEYRASECAHLRTMTKAYKPSQIARAISWAGRDKRFWANQALMFDVVARQIPGWLAAADQGRTMATRGQEIDDTKAKITAMAREIYTMAPLVAHEITEALRADRPDFIEIHAKATKELARLRKKNDKHHTEGTPR